jgi:protein-L-isoaspartate(D-aspartate) O-methyltransferase
MSHRAGRRWLAALAVAASFGDLPLGAQTDPFAAARATMVEEQIHRRGIDDRRLLDAFGATPRHLFVPPGEQREAYEDSPLPIGEGQTISQPYIVALMTSLLGLTGGEKVLEIGTGSGYQAAILARLASEVYTIEILAPLGRQAERVLADQGHANVNVRIGDGYAGWPEAAPFDAIIVTAAPPRIPEPLLAQLKVGGRMVIPVGSVFQDLQVITKTADGLEKRNVTPVRFVPMTGEVEKRLEVEKKPKP